MCTQSRFFWRLQCAGDLFRTCRLLNLITYQLCFLLSFKLSFELSSSPLSCPSRRFPARLLACCIFDTVLTQVSGRHSHCCSVCPCVSIFTFLVNKGFFFLFHPFALLPSPSPCKNKETKRQKNVKGLSLCYRELCMFITHTFRLLLVLSFLRTYLIRISIRTCLLFAFIATSFTALDLCTLCPHRVT